MQASFIIRKATVTDFDAICQLLQSERLPIADLNPLLDNFFIAVESDRIIAVIGMDKYDNDGLLRSAIVHKDYRNAGIAAALIEQLFDHAKQTGVFSLYLITNTAEKYFERKGFTKISRDALPAGVSQSKEFNGLCPSSSVTMFRKL